MKSAAQKYRFIDVAVNLTDCVFRGIDWKGRQAHVDDFDLVLKRARDVGVEKIIISGTNLEQCERAVKLCKQHPGFLYCTVGVHPAHCAEFMRPISWGTFADVDPSRVTCDPPAGMPTVSPTLEEEEACATSRMERLRQLVEQNRESVVAIGEIGLDGAEASYCPVEVQRKYFLRQLAELAVPFQLPLFLHSRECGMSFAAEMSQFVHANLQSGGKRVRGVVHSFNGLEDELSALLGLGFHIGLNASAFRTEPIARQCVKQIPLTKLLLETDAPWCDARKQDFGFPFVATHFATSKRGATFVPGNCVERRNEPCHIIQVLEEYLGTRRLVAETTGDADATDCDVAHQLFCNAMELFFSHERAKADSSHEIVDAAGKTLALCV